MTDLEMTKLCAEAMGYEVKDTNRDDEGRFISRHGLFCRDVREGHFIYRPLHDDAQAMALVKKFGLNIGKFTTGEWGAYFGHQLISNRFADLNRAIVECVAKIKSPPTGSTSSQARS